MGTEATAFAYFLLHLVLLYFVLKFWPDPIRRSHFQKRQKRNKSEYFCVNVWPISSTTDGFSNADLRLRHLVYCLMQITGLQDRHVTCKPLPVPEIVISAATTDTFKRRLDKFWQHQDILYHYKVELTGVGNRSQINTDDNIVL